MSVDTPSAQDERAPERRRRPARSWTGWGFVGPFMAVFALVFLAPIAYSLYISLFRQQLIGGNRFVGVDNYRTAFSDPLFWSGVQRVGLFLLVQVPIMLGIALFVALAIDSGRLHGRNFFRISIFLPYAVPAVVATLMWGFMYGKRFGLVATLDGCRGLPAAGPAVAGRGAAGHRQHRDLGVRRLQHADLLLRAAGDPGVAVRGRGPRRSRAVCASSGRSSCRPSAERW